MLMERPKFKSSPDKTPAPKSTSWGWGKGVCLSVCFHVALFSLVLFVPDSFPTRRISGATVYEVNLVEMPGKTVASPKTVAPSESGKKTQTAQKDEPTKRISRPQKKEKKPVVISKRVVETKQKKKPEVKKREPKVSPSKLIDDAVSKVEKRVEPENDQHVDDALSKLKARVEGKRQAGAAGGGGADTGIGMRMYQMEVEQRIKSNWSCPVSLLNPKRMKELEAIVVVKVKQDGSIMKSWLERKSSDGVFDRSVRRAVDRSDPLPPFPEGYKRSFDEIEVRFNLSEMDGYY